MKLINDHLEQIKKLCQSNGVNHLFAFGSITSGKFTGHSDIDLIVDIEESDPLNYSDKYFNLKFKLQNLLGRSIDLLEQKAIKNPFLKQEIDRTKILVYGK